MLWGDQVLAHEAWLPWDFDIVVAVVKKIPEDADGPHFHISFLSLQPWAISWNMTGLDSIGVRDDKAVSRTLQLDGVAVMLSVLWRRECFHTVDGFGPEQSVHSPPCLWNGDDKIYSTSYGWCARTCPGLWQADAAYCHFLLLVLIVMSNSSLKNLLDILKSIFLFIHVFICVCVCICVCMCICT